MPFTPEVAEQLLVAAHRHCCLCHKPCGVKIEIHHIVQETDGGESTFDNGMPLCFDCHAEVKQYNDKHPRGRKFHPSELRKHRDQWFAIAARSPWQRAADVPILATPTEAPRDVVLGIRTLDLWNPDVSETFLPALLALDDAQRRGLMDDLDHLLLHDDDDVRWHAAIVVEFFVQWDPLKVPDALLRRMSLDRSFSVRSSAAVGYFWLSCSSPNAVPVEMLGKLASYDEDWYVYTPAVRALVQLARTRPAAVEVLAQGLATSDLSAQQHAAEGLKLLLDEEPAALLDSVKDRLLASPESAARDVGTLWEKELTRRQGGQGRLRFYPF